jgi:hypothetical protein
MDLAKLRWLFVIARNSSFTFRAKAVDVRLVSRGTRGCAMCGRAVSAAPVIAFV